MARLLSALRRRWPQTVLIMVVLVGFLINAAGPFELDVGIARKDAVDGSLLASPGFALLLLTGLVLALSLPLLSPIKASLLTLACSLPAAYLGYVTAAQETPLSMEYVLLAILVLFVVHVLTRFFAESTRRQALVKALGQYMPSEIAAGISENPKEFSLEGEARELSVMFCDVQKFTAISEKLEPKQLALLLNTLFTPLTRIIYKHGGVVDKYMGDAIMAFWGAPGDDPHHAARAVAASFEIQEQLVELREEFLARGWPPIRMGIGINTGVMNVGNMGSEYRMAYTVVGDAVNLASRLEGLTRMFKAKIIVGAATRKAFPAPTYRELGLVQVRGKNALVRIYEPCNPKIDPQSTLVSNMNRHNEALGFYYGRDWDQAERHFEYLKAQNPEDPLYDYFLSRVARFRRHPPPTGWRGEIRYLVN